MADQRRGERKNDAKEKGQQAHQSTAAAASSSSAASQASSSLSSPSPSAGTYLNHPFLAPERLARSGYDATWSAIEAAAARQAAIAARLLAMDRTFLCEEMQQARQLHPDRLSEATTTMCFTLRAISERQADVGSRAELLQATETADERAQQQLTALTLQRQQQLLARATSQSDIAEQEAGRTQDAVVAGELEEALNQRLAKQQLSREQREQLRAGQVDQFMTEEQTKQNKVKRALSTAKSRLGKSQEVHAKLKQTEKCLAAKKAAECICVECDDDGWRDEEEEYKSSGKRKSTGGSKKE